MSDDKPRPEWTPRERAALDELPRELDPDPALKSRVIWALRSEDLIASSRASSWVQIAAAAALLVAGFLAGQTVGSQEDAESQFVAATNPELAPAEQIQRVGTHYVATLEQLVTVVDSAPAATVSQGREVAMSTLQGAAEYLVRLPGHEEHVERLLRNLRSADFR